MPIVLTDLAYNVKTGALADNAARTANTTAINQVLSIAAATGMTVEAPAGTYELFGKIVVPSATKVVCDGIKAKFIQYQDNTAVFHFGAALGSSASASDINIDGGWYSHANTQAGNTSARVWEFTGVWGSVFQNALLGNFYDPVGAARVCNYGIWTDNGANVIECFNNTFSNIKIKYFDQAGIYYWNSGTGSSFDQIYIQNGNATDRKRATFGIVMEGGSGSKFGNLNIEWGTFTRAFYCNSLSACRIESLHIEECGLFNTSGNANRGLVELTGGSHLSIGVVSFYKSRFEAINNLQSCAFFQYGDACYLDIDFLKIEENTVTGTALFHHQSVDNATGIQQPFINVVNIRSAGTTRPVAVDNITLSAASATRFKYQRMGMYRSAGEELVILADSAQTIYAGTHPNEIQMTPSSTRVLTLSNATSSTTPTVPPPGCMFTVTCAGSAGSIQANNFNAMPLKTIAPGFWATFQFDGGNWIYRRGGPV